MNLFADAELSSRLETLSAREMERFVMVATDLDPYCEAAMLRLAGGVAAYLGQGSPVNQAVGLGVEGTVLPEDIGELHEFYASRSQRGLVVASPLADRSLFAGLSSQRWAVDGFENVLVREYAAGERFGSVEDIEIIEAEDDEQKALWAHVAAVGFAAPLEPPPVQLALARVVASRPHTRLLLALVDGMPAGTGEVYIEDGVAWLSADATLPPFRRRGVQQALQLARLRIGADAGCELAVSEAIPGSGSQRNMERLGFQIAYTRIDFLAPEVS